MFHQIVTNAFMLILLQFVLGSFSLSFFLIIIPGNASAANITVNSTEDAATARDGKCTLREAITNANSNGDTTGEDCVAGSGADTITFGVSGTITLRSTPPEIVSPDGLTVDGGSAVTISGNNSVRAFVVRGGASLTLQNLTITKCNVSTLELGGGINNRGTLTIINSMFTANSARRGGGIFNNGGTLTVANSTFSDNSAFSGSGITNEDLGILVITNSTFSSNSARNGGGIENRGTLTITNSTFSRNSASIFGGGIEHIFGTLTITNSTFSGNSADNSGGGIFNQSALTITNSTFSGNSARQDFFRGGAIASDFGTTTLRNTIVANSPSGGNCSGITTGTITDGGFNIADDTTCGFSAANKSHPSTNPKLDTEGLKDNTGPTRTIALQSTSPAIDAGNDAFCPPLDQTGQERACLCDIGAFEFRRAVEPIAVLPNNTQDLINAIGRANEDDACNVITVTGTYPLSAMHNETDGPNGLPSINSKILIKSTGANPAIIQREPGPNTPAFRVLHVAPRGALTLERLTIRGGLAADNNEPFGTGGGILNTGALTLLDSTVRNNRAFLNGGGIENSAMAILTRSTISGNVADTFGGGINNFVSPTSTGMLTLIDTTVSGNDASDGGGIENSAKAVVMRSTISGNTTDGRGGGIANVGDKTELTLLNSTISTNMASSGGGIANFGAATLTSNNLTITNNTASGGGGFFNEAGSTVNISNTIIAQNTSGDCDGNFTSRGHNLVGSNCQGFNQTGDRVGANAMLDVLAPNGGTTLTHALRPGSDAIDGGDPAAPGSVRNACEPTDQRGFRRPVDGPDDGSTATCDIGAFEAGMRVVNPMVLAGLTGTSFDPTPVPGGPAGTFTVRPTFTNASPTTILNPIFEVVELSGGNLLLNADGGPGGVGARLTLNVGADGVLLPGESFTANPVVGLQTRERFTFFVNLLGMPSP